MVENAGKPAGLVGVCVLVFQHYLNNIAKMSMFVCLELFRFRSCLYLAFRFSKISVTVEQMDSMYLCIAMNLKSFLFFFQKMKSISSYFKWSIESMVKYNCLYKFVVLCLFILKNGSLSTNMML